VRPGVAWWDRVRYDAVRQVRLGDFKARFCEVRQGKVRWVKERYGMFRQVRPGVAWWDRVRYDAVRQAR
jgi:hypothetical protein